MSISFSENMLKEAVIQADIYEMQILPADSEIAHKFSGKFERKMKVLIRQNKTRYPAGAMTFLRKNAVAFIAAIIILLASAMSVSAVRTSVFEFVTKAYEKFTHIFFSESRSSQDETDGFNIYEPTYIPEGFRLVSKSTGNLVLLEYENENDFISYSQQYLENISIVTNTEGVELEELEFKGFPARYYSNKGVQNLLWYDDKYMYIVSSTLDRDIVFKISESIEAKDIDTSP